MMYYIINRGYFFLLDACKKASIIIIHYMTYCVYVFAGGGEDTWWTTSRVTIPQCERVVNRLTANWSMTLCHRDVTGSAMTLWRGSVQCRPSDAQKYNTRSLSLFLDSPSEVVFSFILSLFSFPPSFSLSLFQIRSLFILCLRGLASQASKARQSVDLPEMATWLAIFPGKCHRTT